MKNLLIATLLFTLACSSSENHQPSAFDINHIDQNADPCTNFYNYAIGNWQKNNPIPETESRWMAFSILNEDNRQKLLKIVNELEKKKNLKSGSDAQIIRDFYKSGIDTTNREKLGIALLHPIIKEIKFSDRHEDIIHLFGELAPIGIGTPINFGVSADKKNSKINAIYASQSGLSLPDRDYYLSDKKEFIEYRKAYVEHINAMMKIAGLSMSFGDKVLNVETKIAEISWTREQRRDPVLTYNPTLMSDWNASLKNLQPNIIFKTRGFNDTDSLIVNEPSYFIKLDSLLNQISIADWRYYLIWKTLHSYANVLQLELEKENFDFWSTTLRGTEKMKSTNERVFNQLNGQLGEPLGKLFVQKHFSEESKSYVINMVENLRSAYRASIEELEWMGPETKKKAIKKLESFTYKIGYPDEWKDYSSLQITPDNYGENTMNVRMFNFQRMLEKQGKPVDKKEWHMTPQMVNAYYSASNNEIVFPAGILQPPFFHKDFDHAINYGGIGAVIGHEFSHGFDDKGSKYDWDGNLNNWWTKEDRQRFEELAAKLGDQYSKYSPVDGFYVNGEMTMGENIADLGGVTLAYAALQKQYKGEFPADIDGFNWQQRFFFGWANIWKGNITEQELIARIKSDNHSPAEFRVNGPLVNLKQFNEAFGPCSDKAMHKADSLKIKIW